MIRHPLTWAFWAAAAGGAVLYLSAMVRAADIVLNWSPEDAGARQLRRERRAEAMNLMAAGAYVCLVFAALVGLIGITGAWPAVVPGAMCGTGVLQAMGVAGTRALLFWGIALALLYAGQVQQGLDRFHPRGRMTRSTARLTVAAGPLLALALFFSWQALMRIDTIPTVSCCAAVYDRVLEDAASPAYRWVEESHWIGLACQAVLLTMAVATIRRPQTAWGGWTASLAIVWAIVSTVAVKHHWSAYIYQVLSHPCPWCLFLPEHAGIGFPIFGCMAVTVMESLAMAVAHRVRRGQPRLSGPAIDRIRRAATRMAVCLVGFTLLTAGPAVAWRLRSGTWLDGSF